MITIFHLLLLLCVFFILCEVNQLESAFVCQVENDVENNLIEYRYEILCHSASTDCLLNHKFRGKLYFKFVILLHNRQWSLIQNVTDHLANCNVKYLIVDINDQMDNIIFPMCSTNQTTLILDLSTKNVFGSEESISNQSCTIKYALKNIIPLDSILLSCRNSIWISGSTDCTNMSTIVHKYISSDTDVLIDKTISKTLLKGRHLRLGMIINKPYFYESSNGSKIGILSNLLEKIANNLQFSYSIHFPNDNKYGDVNDDNVTWTGMIGDLLNNVTDAVFADLTVTYRRSQVVDFTLPYLNEPIGILIQQRGLDNDLWKMFSLFSKRVWVAIICSVVASSLTLYCLHRFSAVPIDSPYNNILECFWCSASCSFNQGTEYDMETWSVQNFFAFFWLYVLAVLATYSGGLIAILTTDRINLPFKDLDGLSQSVQQGKFKVCLTPGTALHHEIKGGEGAYSNIREWLNNNPSYVVPRDECVEKLKEHNDIAFLDEITIIEKIQSENCKKYKFVILNDRFFPGYFAMALPKNSSLNGIFSEELTMAVEGGLILGWKKNFSKDSISFCKITKPDGVVAADSSDLSLKEFTGPFIIFGIGIAISFAGFLFERFQLYCEKRRRKFIICPTKRTNPSHKYRHNGWIR